MRRARARLKKAGEPRPSSLLLRAAKLLSVDYYLASTTSFALSSSLTLLFVVCFAIYPELLRVAGRLVTIGPQAPSKAPCVMTLITSFDSAGSLPPRLFSGRPRADRQTGRLSAYCFGSAFLAPRPRKGPACKGTGAGRWSRHFSLLFSLISLLRLSSALLSFFVGLDGP